MAQTVKQKQQAAKAKVAKKTHAQKDKERANAIIDVKVSYTVADAKPAIDDILAKIASFQGYHLKIAQDGVGAKKTGYKLEDGSEEVETVYLTSEQRAAHLDKAAGLQEISDYIERQTKPVSNTLASKAK